MLLARSSRVKLLAPAPGFAVELRAFAPDERIGMIHVAENVWIEPPAERADPECQRRDRVVEYVPPTPVNRRPPLSMA